jgi:NAD(P)-dependent dehydrogenase (short-subunit alcohol dehydrogenase family)
MQLQNHVTIITGGRRGIGLGIAKTFAHEGAQVILASRDLDGSQEAAEALREKGYLAEAEQLNVANASSCAELVKRVMGKHQRIDILVNNAGVFLLHKSEEMPEDDWRIQIDVILTGTFFCAQAVAREAMIPQRRGCIINIGSIASTGGWPMRSAYDAAKAGVTALTKDLATEWAQFNIRVNCVSPGVTMTDMLEVAIDKGVANLEKYSNRVPLRRVASVQEIASAVLFLASDRASYITGVDLRVDGGWVPWANPKALGFPEVVSHDG